MMRQPNGQVQTNEKEPQRPRAESPSQLIDARIKELDDWRGKTLSHVRALIKQADPEVVEEWKWRGVPVWSHDGMICTGETYKSVVKLTFAKGASLKDPSGLFNSSLEGNTRRAIDLHEGDEIDENAFKTLIRAAASPEQVKDPIDNSGALMSCRARYPPRRWAADLLIFSRSRLEITKKPRTMPGLCLSDAEAISILLRSGRPS